MVEKFSMKERKLLKHFIQICENEEIGLYNSLTDIYEDYGMPVKKSPMETVYPAFTSERGLNYLFKNNLFKMNEFKMREVLADFNDSLDYLKEMDIETYDNLDMWMRFGEISDIGLLLGEILKEELYDVSADYSFYHLKKIS